MGNKIDILRRATHSQENYNNTVAENKRQFFQDIVDERFTYATDYEVIQEQTAVGSDLYTQVGVRVTRAISSGLSENFANEVRKIIFQDYKHEQYLGKQYKYNGKTWVTVNINESTGASSHSIVRMCNNILKWINPQNTELVLSWYCIFTKQFSNTSIDEGSEGVPQVKGDFMVIVQQNEITKTIPFNQRFLFDGHAFQVSQINNHLSPTYMTLKLFETQLQPNDDTINNIANSGGLPPTTTEVKILPQLNTILQGETQSYSVHNYINGVANTDTFDIIGTQAPTVNYELIVVDGNNFAVKNISETPIPLIVNCTDITTPSAGTTSIEIILGGSW